MSFRALSLSNETGVSGLCRYYGLSRYQAMARPASRGFCALLGACNSPALVLVLSRGLLGRMAHLSDAAGASVRSAAVSQGDAIAAIGPAPGRVIECRPVTVALA
jgi:hypothetical protein